MTNAQNIALRLQELTNFIEEAHARLNQGEVVNLSHLDDEVGELCNAALTLPADQASQVQAAMAEMISKLESLGLALQEFQNGLKSQTGQE